MKRLAFVLLLLITVSAYPQNTPDSCGFRISLLTCSPGEDLYSIFGHSAIRVKNPTQNIDMIFNYGTFDFDDPGFYSKFIRGKLLYFVSADHFQNFYYSYRAENRGIIEQGLQLNCDETMQLWTALQLNLREENRYYQYDFLFDNCSTRLRDIVDQNTGSALDFGPIVPTPHPTFRNLIHEYLERGGQYWSKLGIDMLLGNKIDRPVQNEEAMFLPDYLMKGFDSASRNGKALVEQKQVILQRDMNLQSSSGWFRPIIATSILLVVFGALQFARSPRAAKILKVFDQVFFLALGLIGCLILFMWFGTDHAMCANNFNLVWAIPTHVVFSLFLNSGKAWVRGYARVMAVWYFLLFFGWALIPQDMNSAFVPIVVLAFIRAYAKQRKT